MTKYIFVGEGDGVPGLPHEVTDEQAAELGLAEILDAAVKNGNYAVHEVGKLVGERPVSTATVATKKAKE